MESFYFAMDEMVYKSIENKIKIKIEKFKKRKKALEKLIINKIRKIETEI